jgi:hypothetical protein
MENMNKDLTKVGGNPLLVYVGNKLHSLGEWISNIGKNISDKNKPYIISNPTYLLVNPFTFLISFSVNGNEKYQIVIQGDYRDLYKKVNRDNDPEIITEEELLVIISDMRKQWYKKTQ